MDLDDDLIEAFTIEYTGNSTLHYQIESVLGNYGYMGILNNAEFYVAKNNKSGHWRGTIYKDWEGNDGWIGTVIF